MGAALAERLVAKGWHVAIADIQPNAAFAAQLGGASTFYACDVASYDSQAGVFQAVWGAFGRIDALCANAGIVDRRFVAHILPACEAKES